MTKAKGCVIAQVQNSKREQPIQINDPTEFQRDSKIPQSIDVMDMPLDQLTFLVKIYLTGSNVAGEDMHLK